MRNDVIVLICDHDLYDISACLVRIRNEHLSPFNKAVVGQILHIQCQENDSNTFMFNQIRSVLSLISNLDKEKWYFVYHENVYVHLISQ